MAWPYFDVTTPLPAEHVEPYAHNYWEINLMCHLLHAYDTYRQMYEAPVAEAMPRFGERVSEIEDEIRHQDRPELGQATKEAVKAQFEKMAKDFAATYPKMTMRELYTHRDPEVLRLLKPFYEILRLIGEDTARQENPGIPGRGRFAQPCQMCLPFLAMQEGTIPPATVEDMDTVIEGIGGYDLAGLYQKRQKDLTEKELAALKVGWASKILVTPRRTVAAPVS